MRNLSNAFTLKKLYFNWLFNEYKYEDIDSKVVKIDTPFLDNQFDTIVMYAEFLNEEKIRLTDDGWTLNDLESHGLIFSKQSTTRNRLLNNIANSLGIEIEDSELTVTATYEKFPIIKQRLLQAIMQVNDLIVLRDNNVKHIFYEEVSSFLDQNGIFNSKKPSFPGKSGITVQFDFSVPTKKGEKLIRTIRNGNDLNRSKLLTMDTQLLRHSKTNAIYQAIYDDINYPIKNMTDIKEFFSENSTAKIVPLFYSEVKNNPSLVANQ
ncbi:DUF1828 domain-containing protein [Aerococcus sp. Group 1]|uniref:DUF1828 domain-containing protein n=1 Tax=Aerococcus urinae (strain CCUG 59500 / ACS-120-V-Col10a) TaxID=2976812 RepID=UPI00227A36DA|nr:DUF1828 domain-containing protein [Aerococcus sp. Group 1]MCY3030602.1 DUF1828 domain-containing protein [Aerococcus sp. Group 1]